MCCVNLHYLGAGAVSPPRGRAKGLNDGRNLRFRESFRNLIAVGEGNRTGREDRRPSAFGGRQRLAAFPGVGGGGLGAGTSKLDFREPALLLGTKKKDSPTRRLSGAPLNGSPAGR